MLRWKWVLARILKSSKHFSFFLNVLEMLKLYMVSRNVIPIQCSSWLRFLYMYRLQNCCRPVSSLSLRYLAIVNMVLTSHIFYNENNLSLFFKSVLCLVLFCLQKLLPSPILFQPPLDSAAAKAETLERVAFWPFIGFAKPQTAKLSFLRELICQSRVYVLGL